MGITRRRSRVFSGTEAAIGEEAEFTSAVTTALALSGLDDPALAARSFQERGARNVLIKMGAAGAFR